MTINPPGLASKSYELYKQELLAWREVTEVCRSKHGIVIALTLPNEEPFKVRENVLNNLSLDELKRENGLDTLIQYLDVYLEKDDLSDRFEKYEDFENFQRTNGQNIREFIAEFDSKYRKLWKMSINLPPEILAFKLLKTVNITKHQKMLVLTGVNFSSKETIYEDMKQSLRKFIRNLTENSVHIGSNVKLEPEFLAKHERELFTAGYVKQPYGGDMRNLHGGSCTENGGQNCGLMHVGKKRNPVGMNGKLLKCKSCGSYRHLVAECPDSWENMENKYVSQKDLKSMFPCVKGGICNNDGLTRSENNGELKVGLEMNYSVPDKLNAEIARLSNEIKCLKDELRMMKVDKDEQIKEQKQGKKWVSSIQEEVVAQITRLKDDLKGIKKIQDDRQIERCVAEQKLEKETVKQRYETRMKFDSTVKELQKRISRLEKERGCTVDNKESDIIIKNQKVKQLNGTRQTIQEITQRIKQEGHKQSIVSQDEQKYGIIQALDDKEELQQYKMIMREILPICDIKLLRMMYCDNQLKYAMNIQEVNVAKG